MPVHKVVRKICVSFREQKDMENYAGILVTVILPNLGQLSEKFL